MIKQKRKEQWSVPRYSESYCFPNVTRREKVKLMGNTVCSPVMEAIVASLRLSAPANKDSKDAA